MDARFLCSKRAYVVPRFNASYNNQTGWNCVNRGFRENDGKFINYTLVNRVGSHYPSKEITVILVNVFEAKTFTMVELAPIAWHLMVAKLQQFSPKQIGKALAVSESSVKRWCDQRRIPSFVSEGGHRRISLEGILEFVRQSQRPLKHPEELGLPPLCPTRPMHIPGADEPVQQLFRDALIAGCEKTCRQIASQKRENGECASSIAEHLLTDAMHAVGDGWQCQTVDPYQERRACEICMRVIRELIDTLPSPAENAPIAIGGAPAGDHYQLPTAMVELTMRELGWNAISLGSDLPMPCFLQAAHDLRPRLVWISVSHLNDQDEFIAAQNRLADALSGEVVLVVGGRALTDSIRPRLRYSAYCDRLANLAELASLLGGKKVSGTFCAKQPKGRFPAKGT